MRKECEKRSLRITGIIGEGKELGAMVDAIALELFAYSGGEALVPEIILYDCDYTYTKAEISSFAASTTYYIYEFGEYSEVPSTATFDSSETYYTRA